MEKIQTTPQVVYTAKQEETIRITVMNATGERQAFKVIHTSGGKEAQINPEGEALAESSMVDGLFCHAGYEGKMIEGDTITVSADRQDALLYDVLVVDARARAERVKNLERSVAKASATISSAVAQKQEVEDLAAKNISDLQRKFQLAREKHEAGLKSLDETAAEKIKEHNDLVVARKKVLDSGLELLQAEKSSRIKALEKVDSQVADSIQKISEDKDRQLSRFDDIVKNNSAYRDELMASIEKLK
jgi:hypothetical protein